MKYISVLKLHRIFLVVSLVALLTSLVACSTGSFSPESATLNPTPSVSQPTPTPAIPAGTVLYRSNWPQGLADWQPTGHWKMEKGYLQSDTQGESTLLVPYKPTVANYEIDYRLQVVSVPHNGGYFRIATDPAPRRDGYFADVDGLLDASPHPPNAAAKVEVMINPEAHMDMTAFQVHDYTPGADWKIYGVQVYGGRAIFLLNGIRQSQAVSTQTDMLSHGPIHFICGGAVLRISGISVIAL